MKGQSKKVQTKIKKKSKRWSRAVGRKGRKKGRKKDPFLSLCRYFPMFGVCLDQHFHIYIKHIFTLHIKHIKLRQHILSYFTDISVALPIFSYILKKASVGAILFWQLLVSVYKAIFYFLKRASKGKSYIILWLYFASVSCPTWRQHRRCVH